LARRYLALQRYKITEKTVNSVGGGPIFARISGIRENPLKYTDPDGRILNLATAAIGAAVGAAIGAGAAALSGASGREIAAAAAGGAVGGGMAGLTMGGSLAVGAAGAGLAAMAGYGTQQIVAGEVATVEGYAYSGVTGVAGYAAGQLINNAVTAVNKLAGSGTESVQRVMSRAELTATQETGLLRGGRTTGKHYVTPAASGDALRARQRLALTSTPEVKVTMEISEGIFPNATKVLPANNMPGGGLERFVSGEIKVPVKITNIEGMY
jgi:hypothetical protein